MAQLFKCSKVNLRPVEGTYTERSFIKVLFSAPDVRKFYVLRDDHAANLDSFVAYMAEQVRKGYSLNYIIEMQDGTQVGLITAEAIRDNGGNVMWNVGYAIHQNYRRKGYATDALMGLYGFLQNFNIPTMMLDISEYNTSSVGLALKCGFEKMHSPTGRIVGFFDNDHPEVGMRIRWVKDMRSTSKRDKLNQEAMACYRMKDYQRSAMLYEQSLQAPYTAGSPFTDGQIYANLGMAYSSLRRYRDAYNALMKAYNMGIRNQSVVGELSWLRKNAGI